MRKSPALMKPHRKYLFTLFGVATVCVAMNSSALTLGRAKGVVFLGQALTLTVPVQMEAGDGASALCFEADVFYGDARQDGGRVNVSSAVSPQTQSATVTVSSQAPVDEPVVTVYLRAGCENKNTRRYVLLAELAATVLTPPIGANTLSAATQATQLPVKGADTAPRSARRATSPAVDAPPTPRSSVAVASVSKLPKPEGRRAHLRLAPLDLTIDREPTLKLSNELAVEEGEDLQRRARATALWRSLNATPQDIQGAEGQRQAMESDLKNLHAITAKNRQLLDDMTLRLGKAESGRYSNPLVYGLLLAFVLCGLAIAFLLKRANRDGLSGAPWWRDESVGDKSETVEFVDSAVPKTHPAAAVPSTKASVSPAATQPLGVAGVDIDLLVDDAVALSRPQPALAKVSKAPANATHDLPVSRAAGHVDFGHSMSATLLRSVNSKEMLDVRQQAEFFMTLGQHEEAIALLRDSVDAGPDANPLVSLELLKVLHTLGRKAEYDHYRAGFNAIFNGHVPVYAEFSQPGSGLEAYPPVCRRIVASWPSEEAVSYIENCLVRTRKESGGQDFDLEAFRDLLMLHGVASRIASSSFDSGFMAFSAVKTAPIPVYAASDAGVDLDLSEPHDGNLIDFDTSAWSPSAPGEAKGKGR